MAKTLSGIYCKSRAPAADALSFSSTDIATNSSVAMTISAPSSPARVCGTAHGLPRCWTIPPRTRKEATYTIADMAHDVRDVSEDAQVSQVTMVGIKGWLDRRDGGPQQPGGGAGVVLLYTTRSNSHINEIVRQNETVVLQANEEATPSSWSVTGAHRPSAYAFYEPGQRRPASQVTCTTGRQNCDAPPRDVVEAFEIDVRCFRGGGVTGMRSCGRPCPVWDRTATASGARGPWQ